MMLHIILKEIQEHLLSLIKRLLSFNIMLMLLELDISILLIKYHIQDMKQKNRVQKILVRKVEAVQVY